MTYGEQLKRLRLGMQPPMTQQRLAELLGVHVTTISRWETDQSVPALGQIRPLARALRVPVDLVLPPETVGEQAGWKPARRAGQSGGAKTSRRAESDNNQI